MRARLRRFWRDEAGVVSIEYALLLSVLAVGGVSVWTALRETIAVAVHQAADSIAGGAP